MKRPTPIQHERLTRDVEVDIEPGRKTTSLPPHPNSSLCFFTGKPPALELNVFRERSPMFSGVRSAWGNGRSPSTQVYQGYEVGTGPAFPRVGTCVPKGPKMEGNTRGLTVRNSRVKPGPQFLLPTRMRRTDAHPRPHLRVYDPSKLAMLATLLPFSPALWIFLPRCANCDDFGRR